MAVRGVLLLAVAAGAAAMLMLAGPASAANLYCGETLTASVTLIGNLDCSSYTGSAIVIGHDGVTLNLNGFSITADANEDAVDNTGGWNSLTVKGGTLKIGGFGNGVDNFEGGNNVVVAGVTIVGANSDDSYGVYSTESSGLVVSGGSMTGVDTGVDVGDETGDLVKGEKIETCATGTCTESYGVSSDTDNTALSIVGNTFTSDTPHTGTAYHGDYDAGTLFSGNTVTGLDYGVETDSYDAGITVTGNVMDGNDYGVYFTDYDSGNVVAGNYIKNSVDEGIEEDDAFNDTYNGNVLTSNGSTSDAFGYYIDSNGYGPVTMVNNYARTGDGWGFYVSYAYSSSVPGGPYSLFTGNVATANGSSNSASGFYDLESVGATWSKNVANYNATDGFDFDYPWRETITGNSATLNGGDGFFFGDNLEDYQPLAVTNNSATYNGAFGFSGAYPVAGSGNTGGKTNALGDCNLVAGCS